MKTIFFDFFGVISTPAYMKVIRQFIPEAEQQPWVKRLDVLDLGELAEADLVRELAAAAKVSEEAIWEVAKAAPVLNSELLAYIATELKGKYELGLLTNIPRNMLDRILGEKEQMFDIVVVSSEVHLVKPDPKIFEYALSKTASKPGEILFIDDSQRNIDVAKSLGMQVALYRDLDSVKGAVAVR